MNDTPPDETPLRLLWQVDDSDHWHEVTDASLAQVTADIRVQHFHTGQALLMALAGAAADSGPDAILMDYFIGPERGDAVTRDARTTEAGRRTTIIGFSSVLSGSRAIERAGADYSLPKYDQGGINPDLIDWLRLASDMDV